MIRITSLDLSHPSFIKDLKRLPGEIVQQAKEAFKDLLKEPRPGRLRFEKLTGYRNPNIYTIHITRNHSHKVSFEIIESTAVMRRIGTHKEIDRTP